MAEVPAKGSVLGSKLKTIPFIYCSKLKQIKTFK